MLPKKTPRSAPIGLRTEPDQKERWQAHAAAEGYRDLSDWIRDVCNAHCEKRERKERDAAANDREASGPRRRVA